MRRLAVLLEIGTIPPKEARKSSDKDDVPHLGPVKALGRRRMLNRLFGVQSINLERGLDRASQRFSLVSTNLANVNVPGYKRKDVDFGIQLAKSESDIQRRETGAVDDRGEIRVDGSSVDLEQEAMAVSESELRYQVLTEMTSKYFAGLKNAIKEGR